MTFTRDHDDLHVVLDRDRSGRIIEADLYQPSQFVDQGEDWISLTRAQLYALVDDVAVADPDEWARRFDPRGPTELALRRVADYFRERARVNRASAIRAESVMSTVHFNSIADTFDLAVTTVMEEIEALYPEVDVRASEDRAREAIQNKMRRN